MAQVEQERYTHWSPPYRDILSRDMQVSPPTRYMSPPLREHSISPPSPPVHQTYPYRDQFQGSSQGIDDRVTRGLQPYSNYRGGYDPSVAPPFYPENAGDHGFPRYNGQPHLPESADPFTSQPARSSPYPELPLPTDSDDTPTPVQAPNPSRRRVPPIQTAGEDRYWGANLGYSNSMRTASTTTPGMDNLGAAAAGGGIAGIAMGVANTNERESGVEALRAIENHRRSVTAGQGYGPPERGFDVVGSDTPYVPQRPEPSHALQQRSSYSSTVPLGLAAASPGQITPRLQPSDDSIPLGDYPLPDRHMSSSGPSYADNPYNHFSTAWDPRIAPGAFNPNEIVDDGDDGFASEDPKRRRSVLNSGKDFDRGTPVNGTAAGVAEGGILGGLGGLLGRKRNSGAGVRGNSSGQYGPVPGQGFDDGGIEKSEWLNRQTTGRRKLRLIVGIVIGVLVVAIVVGAIVGGVLGSKNGKSNTPSSGLSAAQDDGKGDLTKDSAEIKKLLGNKDLHKVFPGMDYTPFNTQYPECLANPPSQNNVTRDMAVMSQLTNAVRLYGTDCNQTEMVLHSIDKLSLTDMKVWLGVWLSNNATTNDRQLTAMYNLLDKHGATSFAGVIVGNEVLFRKDITEADLGLVLSGVKSNFTSKKLDLPVATSDLGDNWTAGLIPDVDIVMSNVHPFFAGVEAAVAAGWTWNFWQTHDVVLTQGTTKKNFISEVGWPSAGGNDCGAAICAGKTAGSVAGVDQMNLFMKDFVCESLVNGTEYFWFVVPIQWLTD